MFCPECGHDVEDDARFCPSCGKGLKPQEAPPESEAAPPEPDEAAAPPPQPAVPPPPAPSVPPAIPTEPAVPSTVDTAREGAAWDAAEQAETPAVPVPEPPVPGPTPPPMAPEPAYRPWSDPAAPTPVPPGPVGSTAPQPPSIPPQPSPEPPPPAVSSAVPPGTAQPGQVPPQAQPPAPGVGVGPAGAPPEEKKTNWGSICLIGCGILLVLAILGGIATYFITKAAVRNYEELETTINGVEIWEPGDGPGDAGTSDDVSDETEDGGIGDLIGRMGEAVEGMGAAVSAANVDGFDPGSVDAAMLPTFYGFMIALADDNPQAMHQWMSPGYQEEWTPDGWEPATHIEHLNYRLEEKSVLSDGTVVFMIEETVRDNDENVEKTIPWEIHFSKTNGRWFVTYFE